MLRALLSDDLPRSRWLAVALVALLIGLALAPFLFPGAKSLNVAAKICVFIVLAASFDLLLGYTGIVSFAHTMFFGIGAYGVAIALTRMGPGCTRGNCFDSTRNVLWTAGGNGWSGVGTYSLQSYDVATDRFTPAGPKNPWGGGEAGMFVHAEGSKAANGTFIATRVMASTKAPAGPPPHR